MSDYLEAYNYALSTDCGHYGESMQDACSRVESRAHLIRDGWIEKAREKIRDMAEKACINPDKVIVC